MVYKAFSKNKRALFGVGVLLILYSLAGFTFVNTQADYRWLSNPNEIHIGEKLYLVQQSDENKFAILPFLLRYFMRNISNSLESDFKEPRSARKESRTFLTLDSMDILFLDCIY